VVQADGSHQADRDAEPAADGGGLDGGVRADGLRLEAAASWRVVGGQHHGRLSARSRRAVHRARPSTAQRRPAALPHAARPVDPASVRSHQHLPDGHALARHLDTLRRLDDLRSATALQPPPTHTGA